MPRRVVWFRPVKAARMAPAERSRRMGVVFEDCRRRNRIERGNSFCQVARAMHMGQLRPSMTLGNQK